MNYKKMCLQCIFWEQSRAQPLQGKCRKYAPRPDAPCTWWSPISYNDWCGELNRADEDEISKREERLKNDSD